jgi:hypothetical protein
MDTAADLTFPQIQEWIGAQFQDLLVEIAGEGTEANPITPDHLRNSAEAAAAEIFQVSLATFPGKWVPAVTVSPWGSPGEGQFLISIITVPRVGFPPTMN